MNLDHAIGKRFHRTQFQWYLEMTWRDERNAFPNEDWNNGDNEFVDRVFIQERRNELPATHHPDILAGLVAETFGKRTNRLRDEFDASRYGCRRRLAREHVMPIVAR